MNDTPNHKLRVMKKVMWFILISLLIAKAITDNLFNIKQLSLDPNPISEIKVNSRLDQVIPVPTDMLLIIRNKTPIPVMDEEQFFPLPIKNSVILDSDESSTEESLFDPKREYPFIADRWNTFDKLPTNEKAFN